MKSTFNLLLSTQLKFSFSYFHTLLIALFSKLLLGGANTETNSSSTPFSLNQLSSKPLITIPAPKADDEESEEPPKNDFVPVVEEDSIFDMK